MQIPSWAFGLEARASVKGQLSKPQNVGKKIILRQQVSNLLTYLDRVHSLSIDNKQTYFIHFIYFSLVLVVFVKDVG